MIYLDHNASSPLLPAAWDAMRPLMLDTIGNASSSHAAGRAARRHLEDARETVAKLIDCLPEEVVFTSGATEANNLALFGLATKPPGTIYTSLIEHPCIVEPLKQLAARGFAVANLPVNERGQVIVTNLAPATLVTLMLANHETGVIQPIADAVASGVPVHCDAAQAIGKIPVSFRKLGVTTLTASAHKFRGPKGAGFLIVKKGTVLRPLLYGGHQQRGHRPGTEPIALAVGLTVALEHAVRTMTETAARLTRYRQQLWDALQSLAAPVVLNGLPPSDPASLPTTLNVSFPGCRADLLLMALDLAGVACSTGSACSSGSLLPSPVIAAMRASDEVLRSAMRFSVGEATTEEDITQAIERIVACVANVRQSQ